MDINNISFQQTSAPHFLGNVQDLERIADVASVGLTAAQAGLTNPPNTPNRTADTVRVTQSVGDSLSAPIAAIQPLGILWTDITEHEFVHYALATVPMVATMLSSEENKVITTYLNLLTAGAEFVQSNQGTGFTTTVLGFTGQKTITTNAQIGFNATLQPAISDKARRAVAMMDSWLNGDEQEQSDTLETIKKGIRDNRKGYRQAI